MESEIIQNMQKAAEDLEHAVENGNWTLVGELAQTAKVACLRAERSELLGVFLSIQGALARGDRQSCRDLVRDELLKVLARLRLQAASQVSE